MIRRPGRLIVTAAVLACAGVALWAWATPRDDDDGDASATVRSVSVAQAPPTRGDGALRWLGGNEGCLKGAGGKPWVPCRASVPGQFDVSSIAISSDGRFAYGVSPYSGYRFDSSGKRISDAPGGTVVAFARNRRTGTLTPLRGRDTCASDREAPLNRVTAPCALKARGLGGAKSIVLSPDGRFVYVASLTDDAIAAFRRNRRTGAIRQLRGRDACIGGRSPRGRRECPRRARALLGIRWLAPSPDGRHLYASSPANDAIAAFARNPRTGGLTQLPGADACIEDRLARRRSGCPTGVGLNYPRTIAISPDGLNAYVASDTADSVIPGDPADGDAVSAFARDPRTGALRQLPGKAACVKDTIARSITACESVGRGLLDAFNVSVSPDGQHVYVASDASRLGAIAIFRREATGELSQLPGTAGCLGNGRGCGRVKGIAGTDSVTLSPNGRRLYATGFFGWSLGVFSRDPVSGAIRQLPGATACVRDVNSKARCGQTVKGLQGPRDVVLSPDGRTAYVPSSVGGTINVFAVGSRPRR